MPIFYSDYAIIKVMTLRGLIDGALSHFKLIMGIIWALILVCGGICLFSYMTAKNGPKETLIILNVAPVSSKITLDGEYVSSGSHSVAPGEHKISISADGFEGKDFTITAAADKTTEVSEFLANKTEGDKYYRRSESNVAAMRIIAKTNKDAKKVMDDFDNWYSVTNKMPLSATYNVTGQTESIKITSSNEGCKYVLCIHVSGTVEDTSRAKEKTKSLLSDNGFNIDDYEVIYEL